MRKQCWKRDFASFILDDSAEDQAMAIKIQHFPRQLFRYGRFDENGFWEAPLLKHQLWLSSPRYFNDPYDCELVMGRTIIEAPFYRRITFKVVQENFPECYAAAKARGLDSTREILELVNCYFKKDTPGKIEGDNEKLSLDHFIENIYNAFNMGSIGGLKVLCFSEAYNLSIMWSHYADNHRGFCIGYDFISDTRTRTGGKGVPLYPNIWPVIYQHQRVDFGELCKQGKIGSVTNAALFKSLDWKYEKEWRLIWSDIFDKQGAYVKDGGCMRTIYLGAKTDISSKNIKRVLKQAKNIGVSVFKWNYRVIHMS